MRFPLLAAGALVLAAMAAGAPPVLAADSAKVQVPFVSCPSDGQQGPQDGPADDGKAPEQPAALGERLAWYASDGPAMLAPRGWHCLLLDGSDGVVLILTPVVHTPDELFGDAHLTGPAEIYDVSDADTSGRFGVAQVIARFFPAQKKFLEDVIAEGIEDKKDFPVGPVATDIVTQRTTGSVHYVTPANRAGFGTENTRLAPDGDDIVGVAAVSQDADGVEDSVAVAIRLPPDMDDLRKVILANAAATATAP